MNLWFDPEHDLAGIRPLWNLAGAPASRDTVIDRFAKRVRETHHDIGMETDDIGDPGEPPDEQAVIRIERDPRVMISVCHDVGRRHGR